MKNYLLGLATLPAAFVGLGIADRVVEWVDGRFTFLRPIAHLRPEYQARLITALPPAPAVGDSSSGCRTGTTSVS